MPGLHAELSPSSAKRWIRCAASIRAIRAMYAQGKPQDDNIFSREGTAAHEAGQLCLTQVRDAIEVVGRTFNTDIEFKDEWVEHLQLYLDLCREEAGDARFFVEQKINLDALNPPAPVWGTSDFFTLKLVNKTLVVIDLKFGQGIVVEAEENEQGRVYGLGSLLLLLDPANGFGVKASDIEYIEVVICQPRAYHPKGPVRRERISVAELAQWYNEVLKPAIALTQDPNAPFVAGDHCELCPMAGNCKALQDYSLARAELLFQDAPGPLVKLPPAPETLSIEDMIRVHEARDGIEAWMAAVDKYLFRLMSDGVGAAGYKLAATYGHRRFKGDAETIAASLTGLFSVTEREIYQPPKLRSPAQIEKILPKDEREAFKALWEKPVTGATIVPSDNERDAVGSSAEALFLATPDVPVTDR